MTERHVDLSGGCEHLREIAEESGMEWEEYHSNIKHHVIRGANVETWYNESASSPWNAWQAFTFGIGSVGAPSEEEVVEKITERIVNHVNCA